MKNLPEKHQWIVHLGLLPYNCNKCKSIFGEKGGLKTHQDSVYFRLKPFKRNACEATFEHLADIKTHTDSVHLGSKPFNVIIVNLFLNLEVP